MEQTPVVLHCANKRDDPANGTAAVSRTSEVIHDLPQFDHEVTVRLRMSFQFFKADPLLELAVLYSEAVGNAQEKRSQGLSDL